MASKIQSVDLLVGPTVMLAAPGFYNGLVKDGTGYTEADLGIGDTTVASTLDTNGYRGALITVHHSPRAGTGNSIMSFAHGDDADSDNHEVIGNPNEVTFIRSSGIQGGTSRAVTVLVDTSRLKRYLSVLHLTGGNQLVCVTATPILPLQPRKDQLDRTTAGKNLFITGTGELSFPAVSSGA